MNRLFLSLLMLVSFLSATAQRQENALISFKENKGQLTDQHRGLRSDVLYYGNNNGLSFFLKQDGISYQLYRRNGQAGRKVNAQGMVEPSDKKDTLVIQRLDVKWLGANINAPVTTGDRTEGVDNYYLAHCPDGIMGVKNYGQLIYHNIYPDIDLKYYSKNGSLKYDYIVKPGASPSAIRFKLEGATSIKLNRNGSLSFNTPLGAVDEGAPEVFPGWQQSACLMGR
jgi:hypothetical protein